MKPTLARIARYAFLAIPLLGLAELAGHVYFARRTPSFDAWFSIASAVRARKKEGDLLLVAPPWADPVARRALGDELMPVRDEARPDVTRYATALELSILGESARELAGWHEDSSEQIGKFRLRRLSNPRPAHVVFDFVDGAHPPLADVRVVAPAVGAGNPAGATTTADCPWNPHATILAGGLGGTPTFGAQRFECAGAGANNVGPTVIADQDFRPRRCLWSHPPSRGEVVTRFHGVPLGSVLRGHGGMYWVIERLRTGAPVTLTVRVDGETVGQVIHRDGDGWAPFEIPLGAHAGAASAEVEFAVSTPNNLNRHYCFEADTR